ncbi:hypothetical protein Gorai_022891 [Gossypium raimondii]|uniref:CCHC-type domain-containing protein n=1 Tax=Gossypium raimondii TaxID=29730 RepID=A0A7J8NV29_GOSRA|nr:hypothetical protein [Gossypium raimondii]
MDESPDLDDLMMNEKRVRVERFVTEPVSWKEKLIGSVPVEIIDLENDYFSVKFQTDEEYLAVLFGGPWKIFEHYLIVLPWMLTFSTDQPCLTTLMVWIRLSSILEGMGQFIRLVFIDLEKPLVSKMRIDGKVQRVEYESLQLVCFECGRFGHKSDLCPHGSGEIEVSKGVSKGRVSKEISMNDRVEAEKFGILSWSLGDIDGNKSPILNGREENKEFGEEIVENGESNKGNIKAEAKIKMAISRKRAFGMNGNLFEDGSRMGPRILDSGLEQVQFRTDGNRLSNGENVKVVVEDAIMVGSDTVMVESNDETLADIRRLGGFLKLSGEWSHLFQNFLSEYKKDFKLDLVALFEIRINESMDDSVVTKLGFEIFFKVEVMGFKEDLWMLWNDDVGIDILKELSGLGFQRSIYTWSKGSLSQRLDRPLGNDLWLSFAPNTFIRHLYKLKSDNLPILVSANMTKEIEGERSFCFLAS